VAWALGGLALPALPLLCVQVAGGGMAYILCAAAVVLLWRKDMKAMFGLFGGRNAA